MSVLDGREQALRRLELSVTRKLEGYLHGDVTGLRTGPGSEPDEARPYHPGQDDVRRMDWTVTARSLEPHVRAPLAERELEAWALVDASASMDFGTALQEKRDLAVAVVAAIGLLVDRPAPGRVLPRQAHDQLSQRTVHQRPARRPARVGPAAGYRVAMPAARRRRADRQARPTLRR